MKPSQDKSDDAPWEYPQAESKFFSKLPANLRLRIYEICAADYAYGNVVFNRGRWGTNQSTPRQGYRCPALLLTCRRAAVEATAIMHQSVCIEFYTWLSQMEGQWELIANEEMNVLAATRFEAHAVRQLHVVWQAHFPVNTKTLSSSWLLGYKLEWLFKDARADVTTVQLDFWATQPEGKPLDMDQVRVHVYDQLRSFMLFLKKLPSLEEVRLGGEYVPGWGPILRAIIGVRVVVDIEDENTPESSEASTSPSSEFQGPGIFAAYRL